MPKIPTNPPLPKPAPPPPPQTAAESLRSAFIEGFARQPFEAVLKAYNFNIEAHWNQQTDKDFVRNTDALYRARMIEAIGVFRFGRRFLDEV